MGHSKTSILSIAVAMLISLFVSIAGAQEVPILEQGRHVYAIPAGYVVPEVGPSGVQRLEHELEGFHHPFIVLMVEDAGVDANGVNAYIDNIVGQWLSNQSDRFTARTSVFTLMSHPREARMLPARDWSAQLNLHGPDMQQYVLQHFVPYVRHTPKDPTSGILETGRALDTFAFEQTDPEQIRLREERAQAEAEQRARYAEEERTRQIAEEHAQAARNLSNEVYRAQTLLSNDPQYLPGNLGAHHIALEEARRLQGVSDATTAALQDTKNHLQSENNSLESFIQEHKDVESWAALMSAMKWVLAALLLVAILIASYKRTQTIRKLREELAERLGEWQPKVTNAFGRYVAFDDQRNELRSMANKVGRSGELYRDVTTKVDAIFVLIEAMRVHLVNCAALGTKGGFFNADPLRKAIEMVDETFAFDTEVIDQTRLFHPQTVQMEVTPSALENDLKLRFEAAMGGWKMLRDAYSAGTRDPRKDLPMSEFEALQQRATDGQIPAEWLNGHPLAHQQGLYLSLEHLRDTDAVSYCERILSLQAQAAEVAASVDELITLVQPIFGNSTNADIPEGTVVDLVDSPLPHVEAALRGEGELSGMLKALRPKDELKSKIDAIQHERSEATRKAELVRFCIEKAGEALEAARIDLQAANDSRARTNERLDAVRKTHAEVDTTHAAAGNGLLTQGNTALVAAGLALKSKQHVSARRQALEASKHLQAAMNRYQQAQKYCDSLDQAVVEATQKITQGAEAQSRVLLSRDRAQDRVRSASNTHANVRDAQRYLDRAATLIGNGEGSLQKARNFVTEKRYIQARANADEALTRFREASTAVEDANQWCNEQDKKKAEYEAFIANAGRYRSHAESRIRGAGRSVNIALFRPSPMTGAIDYAAALSEAVLTRNAWDQAARRAEEEYAEEQRAAEARRRAEEEADRRRRQQAEDDDRRRREDDDRRSSYSSSSSSSSSSDNGGSSWSSSDSGGGSSDNGGSSW